MLRVLKRMLSSEAADSPNQLMFSFILDEVQVTISYGYSNYMQHRI